METFADADGHEIVELQAASCKHTCQKKAADYQNGGGGTFD